MPKAKDNFRSEVTEMTNAETRVFTVTISVPLQDLIVADLLRKRGVLSNPETGLKQAVREAMQKHLEGAEELIASLVPRQQKANGAGKGKGQTEAGAGKVQMEVGEVEDGLEKEPEARERNGARETMEAAVQGMETTGWADE